MLYFVHPLAEGTGVLPESSVVIIEEQDGEGAINLKNTDSFPVLLLSSLQDIEQDKDKLLVITPPAARLEPGKSQRVRFILTSKSPLKTERLKRVIFEGVPPQKKNNNEVRMTVRQNLPVIIRPKGLARDDTPWKRLVWTFKDKKLVVKNPSTYVVRLGLSVTALPGNSKWYLPHAYVLPGQQLILSSKNKHVDGTMSKVRISPATTWGFTVDNYESPLVP